MATRKQTRSAAATPLTRLQFFRDEGCNMVEMTCEEHDRQAASTQFITHTVGRILGAMELKSTEINTRVRGAGGGRAAAAARAAVRWGGY